MKKMMFILPTIVVASRLAELGPTGMLIACAKKSLLGGIWLSTLDAMTRVNQL